MRMNLGEVLRVELWGTSHGPAVGARITGLPAGLPVDEARLAADMARRRPGGRHASARREPDEVELGDGIEVGRTTGATVEIELANTDVHSSDYDFLPDHPRPGHADLPQHVRSEGVADLRGGGVHSGRLTAPLVAAGSLVRPLLDHWGIAVVGQLAGVGRVDAAPLHSRLTAALWADDGLAPAGAEGLPTFDAQAESEMVAALAAARRDQDGLGSRVEAAILGLPLGLGEPWFDGLEPALGRALLAIPAARAVGFGRGAAAAHMRSSEHNDPWALHDGTPRPVGETADGALGGLASGAPLLIDVVFKPPSSIGRSQTTLHVPSGEQRPLSVRGRHDPVIGPRALPVVAALCRLVIADLGLRMGLTAPAAG